MQGEEHQVSTVPHEGGEGVGEFAHDEIVGTSTLRVALHVVTELSLEHVDRTEIGSLYLNAYEAFTKSGPDDHRLVLHSDGLEISDGEVYDLGFQLHFFVKPVLDNGEWFIELQDLTVFHPLWVTLT